MRILIVDSVTHSRESLATYLGLQEHLEVIGAAPTAKEAIYLAKQLQPDVVIMDVNLADMDGFRATSQLSALDIPAAVILLTVHHHMQDLVRAQEAGAAAYIEKSAGVDSILESLHTWSRQ